MTLSKRDLLALATFALLVAVAAIMGGVYTSMSVPEWYDTLAKPDWTPPAWLFGPVWTALYILMALAAWLVWREAGGFRGAKLGITLFVVQLGLNVGWSLLFFGFRSPGWALAEIVVLWLAILATATAFWPRSRTAALLLAPYLAWVAFAGVLNGAIVVMG